MSKHKDNEATKEIKNHLIESDKILKQLIANVFEFANGEPVTVHVIGNPSQKGVKVEVRSIKENKEVLFEKIFETPDDRIYPLKVNSVLHTLLGSSMMTIFQALTPKED